MIMRFVADDYGENERTNEKIEMVCSGGIVRSVTVLAPGKAQSFSRIGGDIAWGAHLYLSDRIPLTDRMRAVKDGKALSKRDVVLGVAAGRITTGTIFHEFEAQLESLFERGFSIEFIDTHQNIHGLPLINGVVKRVAEIHDLGDRIRPTGQLNFDLTITARSILSSLFSVAGGRGKRSKVLVGCPGYGKYKTDLAGALSSWGRFLSHIKRGGYDDIHVPCHPGLSPAEVDIYSSAEFRELIATHNIEVR